MLENVSPLQTLFVCHVGKGLTGKVDLHSALSGPLKRLAYSRIDLSLLQHQPTSQEKHGRLKTTKAGRAAN